MSKLKPILRAYIPAHDLRRLLLQSPDEVVRVPTDLYWRVIAHGYISMDMYFDKDLVFHAAGKTVLPMDNA